MVPKNACATNVVLTVGGISSPAVTIPIAFTPPVVCSIENSATGVVKDATHGLAANSFITVYALDTVAGNSAPNIFPATSYQGVEVLFDGTPVPLYAVDDFSTSQIQINAMVPAELGTTGSAVVTVKTSAGTTASYMVELTAADPGVFRLPNPTTGTGSQGAVLVAGSFRFAMPSSLASAYGLPACTGLPATSLCGQPAAPGDNIVIYLTGGGLATPNGSASGTPVPTGSVAPADGSVIYETVLTPTITIGGLPATVAFSGIAPGTGSEYQINTTIPTGVTTSDTVPVMITMGGNTDIVTISVKAR